MDIKHQVKIDEDEYTVSANVGAFAGPKAAANESNVEKVSR